MILRLELPRLASNMDHGKIVRWHRQVGETVAYGDTLCEIAVTEVERLNRQLSGRQAIRTKKPKKTRVTTMSGIRVVYVLTSMETATVSQILAKEGQDVSRGDLLGFLDSGDHQGTGTAAGPARVVVNLFRDEGVDRE